MEIKVREYVRTEFGNIGKFYRPASESSDVYYIYIDKDGNKISSRYDSIVKHSKNIIDLIEVGDYVNGSKVIEVDNCKGTMRELYLEGQNPEKECGLYFEQIETILTHEQYEQNAYRLEETDG